MSRLYDKEIYSEYQFSQREKEWLSLLDSYSEEEIETLAEESEEWGFFYNFSQLRTGILAWYDFKKGAKILEIGAGYGAITGLLCRRADSVTAVEVYREKAFLLSRRYRAYDNLDIFVGNIENVTGEEYDYIIFNGTFGYQCISSDKEEAFEKYLIRLKRYLKSDGKIIIALENKYGAEMLCGKPAPSTGIPFDTLSDEYREGKYYCFARNELKRIIDRAGYVDTRFFYPLPDYKFTQEIFSDDYLPNDKVAERVVNYYTYHDYAMADERELQKDFIKNGLFIHSANSFLVEISMELPEENIVYATTTIDRGRGLATATKIYEESYVKKQALYSEGDANISVIHENLHQLRGRGVPVVDFHRSNNALVMPRMLIPTLSEYLISHAFITRKEFIEIFEKLYAYILQSSEAADQCNPEFLGFMEKDVSPILKEAFIDMIPFNCFYNGNFLFFDQEYTKENCPANYVIFRALMYTYHFNPLLEKVESLENMKQRFRLQRVWDKYYEIEAQFVAENRRYRKNRLFWNSTHIQKEIIRRNKMDVRGIVNKRYRKENSLKDGNVIYGVGYVAGVFDLFHIGHLNLLKKAKEKSEKLIVGVLDDELVVFFKKKSPYIPLKERMQIIEGCKYVDQVVKVDFSNIDKIAAWNLYHFDCLFSGDDWIDSPQWMEDKRKLQELGSDICFFEYTEGQSSTQIKKLINTDKEESQEK